MKNNYFFSESGRSAIGILLAVTLGVGLVSVKQKTAHASDETYICELCIAMGDSTENACSKLTREGYMTIEEDLNRGVGGEYICLGYKKTSDPSKAISDIILGSASTVNGSSQTISNKAITYTRIRSIDSKTDGNLNEGSSTATDNLWLYTAGVSEKNGTAVTELYLYSGFDVDYSSDYHHPVVLNTDNNVWDLNSSSDGDHGARIYLWYDCQQYQGNIVSPELTLMGDVDLDGEFNAADIILLKNWLLAVPDTKLSNWKNGDFTDDNKINVLDLCMIKRALLENRSAASTASVSGISVNTDNQTVIFTLEFTGIDKSDAWVGIVPSGTEDDEYSADAADTTYKYLCDIISGEQVSLSIDGLKEGKYELRVYSDDDGGILLSKNQFSVLYAAAEEMTVIASNFNIYGVYNNPARESTFTADSDYVLYSVHTYHWNNGNGQKPDSISLYEDGELLGTWKVRDSTSGQGGVPDVNWMIYPADILLKQGHIYTVSDSDKDTWSWNEVSDGAGFFEIKGKQVTDD